MALGDVAAATSWHGILTPATVQRVSFALPLCPWLTITNRGPTEAYVRFDGIDPAIGGDGSFVVAASSVRSFSTGNLQGAPTIGLISPGAPMVSVEGELVHGVV